VITEKELEALGHPPTDSRPPRPVDRVLARGTHLRRRRRAARVGAGAGAAALAVALAATQLTPADGRRPDVQVSPVAQPRHGPLKLVDGETCPNEPGRELLRTSDVPDDLRVIPTRVPGNPPISNALGGRIVQPVGSENLCNPLSLQPDALRLVRTDSHGKITAFLILSGPYSRGDPPSPDSTPTTVRGRPATIDDTGHASGLELAWTEPDAAYWRIQARGMSPTRVRGIAEALHLDPEAEPGFPPADLPEAAIPKGFRIISQASTVPSAATESGTTTTWTVQIFPEGGTRCVLTTADVAADFPILASLSWSGETQVHVGRGQGLWGPGSAYAVGDARPVAYAPSLKWKPSPGVVASLACSRFDARGHLLPTPVSLAEVTAVARSLQPVAADDPRLPRD
jgi:hypothetical protein